MCSRNHQLAKKKNHPMGGTIEDHLVFGEWESNPEFAFGEFTSFS
jgi:hypothetical protein